MTAVTLPDLRRGVVPHDLTDLPVILLGVAFEQGVCVCLRRRVGIGLIEQGLDSEDDVFECDGRLPVLVFVKDGQADGATGVDVRVE